MADLFSHNPAANPGFLTSGTPAAASSSTGGIKVYVGGTWVTKPVKVFIGGVWVAKPLKYYNGTSWVTMN